MDILLDLISPALNLVGFPPENLPLALMRPPSGSGSLGLLTDLINEHALIHFTRKLARRCLVHQKPLFMCLRFISDRWALCEAVMPYRLV